MHSRRLAALLAAALATGSWEPLAADPPASEQAPPPVQAIYRPEFRKVSEVIEALGRLDVKGVRIEPIGPWLDEVITPLGDPAPKTERRATRLLLEGPPERVRELANVLPQADVPRGQVAVRVLVAELRRRDARETGGSLVMDRDRVPGSPDTLFRGVAGAFEAESFLRARLTGVTPFQGTSLALGAFESGGQVYEHVLRVLAQHHRAELLAQSTLVVGEGTPAELRSQVRVPSILLASVQHPVGGTPNATVVQRPVDAGLVLTLGCVHAGPESALLDLEVTFASAEPSPEPDALPTELVLRSRRLATRLAVRHGESTVLGGLTLTRHLGDRRGMPLLDQVPALDSMVSARGRTRETTDLVFVLTPFVLPKPTLGTPDAVPAHASGEVSGAGPAGETGARGAAGAPAPRRPLRLLGLR